MLPQTRLDRFEHRTGWPLAAVAIAFLALYSVQVLAAPGGQINELRDEIRRLARPGGESTYGDGRE